MAAHSWTKEKCTACGHIQRTRGKHFSPSMCFSCKAPNAMLWVSFHCGPEKYAMTYGQKGDIVKNPNHPSNK
jgi:hypothetical protein